MRIVGIDVGLSGAIAILDNQGIPLELIDMPVIRAVKNEIDIVEVVAILKRQNVSHAFIEKAGAMPGQGVVSMFRFGYSAGLIQGICAALNIPFTLVIPQRWKKVMLDGMPKEKGSSIIRAKQLFPSLELNLKKSHNQADAILIGLYGLRTLQGLSIETKI
jgi:crossover junction endodeoxyribonuclease RuvC